MSGYGMQSFRREGWKMYMIVRVWWSPFQQKIFRSYKKQSLMVNNHLKYDTYRHSNIRGAECYRSLHA